MYEKLSQGLLGNANPMCSSLDQWDEFKNKYDCAKYGIRAFRAGDKRTRLNVPKEEVEEYLLSNFGSEPVCISPMVDEHVQLRANVMKNPELYAQVVIGQGHVPWREAFNLYSRVYEGSAARVIINNYLNDNDKSDLEELLEKYPGHVVEFSVLDKCWGISEHRSSVIWEVRLM